MGTRFDATTEHLRDAGCSLLLERGARACTLEALSRAGYVSIGSVYERWGSRRELLADLFDVRLLPALEDLERRTSLGIEPCGLLLGEDAANQTLRLVVEAMFAAREEAGLRPHAQAALISLERVLGRSTQEATDSDVGYSAMTLIGFGLLRTGGCRLPNLAPQLSVLLGTRPAARSRPSSTAVRTPNTDNLASPPSDATWVGTEASRMYVDGVEVAGLEVAELDATGVALQDATRRILQRAGQRWPTARAIASEAGVSTGAIYRRFTSISELLVNVLADELASDRKTWIPQVDAALRSSEPITASAAILARLLDEAIADGPGNRMLLEITVAARTNAVVRAQLVDRIESMARSRMHLFDQLAQAGLIGVDIQPNALAWLLQAPPVGGRLLASIDLAPPADTLRCAIEQIIARAVASLEANADVPLEAGDACLTGSLRARSD